MSLEDGTLGVEGNRSEKRGSRVVGRRQDGVGTPRQRSNRRVKGKRNEQSYFCKNKMGGKKIFILDEDTIGVEGGKN